MTSLQDAYNLLHQGSVALARAELHGIRVDVDYCNAEIERLGRKLRQYERRFKASDLAKEWRRRFGAKTSFGSSTQLQTMLYDVMGIKPTKLTSSGKGSTDEEVLRRIDIPGLQYLLRSRKIKKIRDTYLKAFLREQVDGVLHPSFSLHTVSTYRSSSQNPNFQNIPKRDKEAMRICRRALIPRPGHQLVEIDFSGLEVSIAACYHKDPEMLRYLNDPGSDMHSDIAMQAYLLDPYKDKIKEAGSIKRIKELAVLRGAAKNGFVFPEFYGDFYAPCAVYMACNWGELPEGRWRPGQGIPMPDGDRLSDHLIRQGIKSLDDYIEHIRDLEDDFWGRRFRVYAKWRKRWFHRYQRNGYFDMYTGFRCKGVMTRNEAINYPVQGAAFHCLLWTFIETDRVSQEEGWDTRLVGQIHDAMVLDVLPDELDHVVSTVRRISCQELPKAWEWIIVPLDVEVEVTPVDGSWADMEPYKEAA